MLVGSKSKALQPNTVSGQVINLNTDSTLADGLVTVNCDECALWTVNLTSAGEWAGNQRPVQLLLYYLSRQLHQLLHRTSCLDSQLTNKLFLCFSSILKWAQLSQHPWLDWVPSRNEDGDYTKSRRKWELSFSPAGLQLLEESEEQSIIKQLADPKPAWNSYALHDTDSKWSFANTQAANVSKECILKWKLSAFELFGQVTRYLASAMKWKISPEREEKAVASSWFVWPLLQRAFQKFWKKSFSSTFCSNL